VLLDFLLTYYGWYTTFSLIWTFSLCVSTTQAAVFAIRFPSSTTAYATKDPTETDDVASPRRPENVLSMTDSTALSDATKLVDTQCSTASAIEPVVKEVDAEYDAGVIDL
jgi:hypothetical protein